MKFNKLGIIVIALALVQLGYVAWKISTSGITMQEIKKGDFGKLSADDNDNDRKGVEWESGVFSPDGKYYAYTYTRNTTTSVSRQGGSTKSTGIYKCYFQVIDIESGKKILNHPAKYKERLVVVEFEGNQIWISAYNLRGYSSLCLYEIGDQEMKWKPDELFDKNPNILQKKAGTSIAFNENTTGKPGIVIEAPDGWQYLVSPVDGAMTKVSSGKKMIMGGDWVNYQLDDNASKYKLETEGNARKNIVNNKQSIISDGSYIDPKFLKLNRNETISDIPLTIYNDGFFIYSNQQTSDPREKVLSMLDLKTLKERWSIPIPQLESFPIYEKERFAMKGNQLYVSNKSFLFVIDADKGQIIKQFYL